MFLAFGEFYMQVELHITIECLHKVSLGILFHALQGHTTPSSNEAPMTLCPYDQILVDPYYLLSGVRICHGPKDTVHLLHLMRDLAM